MSEYDLGRHEAMLDGLDGRMSRVEHTVTGFDRKLDTVLEHLAEKRGERKTLVLVASTIGALVSVFLTLIKAAFGLQR